MPEFNVVVYETKAITFAVEAENDIEAGRFIEEDINKYEILDEEVIDWNVDFVEEISDSDTFDVQKCIESGEDYADCVDKLVESMGQSNNE